MHADTKSQSIRVAIQQPSLAKYRVSVFGEFANRSGIRLTLFYSDAPGVPNVPAQGFEASHTPTQYLRLIRRTLMWHSPQWRCAAPNATDVLILSWNLHYASLIPALIRAKINRIPTILWGHGYSKQEAVWRRWPRMRVAKLATALLFYNHTAAKQYTDAGFDPARIFIALNSLDQAPIQHAKQHWADHEDDLTHFRAEHNLTNGPVVLFVSRLSPANRADLLLHAVKQLAHDYPSLKAVIIGSGNEERTRLQSLAQSLDVTPRVTFIPAIYDETQLAPWFLSADVFCYPANIGLSLLHAFGYGLPVVTSDRTDAQNPEIEAIRHEHNGLLYKDGSAASLADALRRLFDDLGLTEQMSQHALQTITERFTLTNMVDAMEAAARYCHAHI